MPFTGSHLTLSHKGWLSEQPEPFRQQLLSHAEFRILHRGTELYGLGEPAGGIYGLASGYVDVMIAPSHFPPRLVHIGGPGWWVGESAAATNTERRAGLRTRTDAVVAYVSETAISRIADTDPEIWRRLAILTVQHLDDALSLAAVLASPVSPTRVTETLKRLTKFVDASEQLVTLPITQADLAEIAGLSRNSLSRLLVPLVEQGYIEQHYGNISVNVQRLRGACAS